MELAKAAPTQIVTECVILIVGEIMIYCDKIKDYVDYLVDVPSKEVPRIQESHIMIGHIICQLVEKTLFGD